MPRIMQLCVLVMLMFFLPACGGLKYNEVSDKAAVYRPRSIAVLPTTVGRSHRKAVVRSSGISHCSAATHFPECRV
jgi:hypothetical protein